MVSSLLKVSQGCQGGHEIFVSASPTCGAQQVSCAAAQGAGLHFGNYLSRAAGGVTREMRRMRMNRIGVAAGAEQMQCSRISRGIGADSLGRQRGNDWRYVARTDYRTDSEKAYIESVNVYIF